MSRQTTVTALAGLLLVGLVTSASAQTVFSTRTFDRICGEGGSSVTFKHCYSAEIVAKRNTSGTAMLVAKFKVDPGGTPGAIITGIALDNVALPVTFTGMSGPYRGSLPAQWTRYSDKTFKGAPDPNQAWDVAVLGSATNFITDVCDPNAPTGVWTTEEGGCAATLQNSGNNNPWVRFFFTLGPTVTDAQLAQLTDPLTLNVRFRYVDNDGTVSGAHCIDGETCASVVPEPITMVLLGTGLAGVGGAGLLRRRRKNGDVVTG
jgi:hypothetical protein